VDPWARARARQLAGCAPLVPGSGRLERF
jgi:hypothetical protein